MEHLSPGGLGERNRPFGIYDQSLTKRTQATASDSCAVDVAGIRNIARRITMILPPGFSRVLPRGYTLEGGSLRMLKVQSFRSNAHLYGLHTSWGQTEAAAFVKDLQDGWLIELSAYMRWQMRDTPEELAEFQKELRNLSRDLEE